MKLATGMRLLGNVMMIGGYIVLLNVDPIYGAIIKLTGGALLIPWMVSIKVWDSIGLVSVFMAIDLHHLIKLILEL